MKRINYPTPSQWTSLMERPEIPLFQLEEKVKGILLEVQQRRDAALYEYAKSFEGVSLSSLLVQEQELQEASLLVSDELKSAIGVAAANIRRFHEQQLLQESPVETAPGVLCWRRSVGIQRVGFYIPGGSAPLFSTILMLAIPAQIAGCKELVLCTPSGPNGKVNPVMLYCASLLGIRTIVKAGGAQAIAAMAYGTESVPKVDKIFGPGNQYVMCAKQLLARKEVAIDMPAGPSELAVFADATAVPEFVAADLLSQAEHGADSQVLLVSTDEQMIDDVLMAIDAQLKRLPRASIAGKAMENSRAILFKTPAEALDFINGYAPEHLILACVDAEQLAESVINAGSVFLGNYSCESAGDYASGTNHTLPTNGYATAYSGVSVDSFVKKITFQRISESGLRGIGPAIELMAAAEGLEAHKNAVTIRIKQKEQQL